MRRERPENILLFPHSSQIEALGIDVADRAQFARCDEAFERHHRRMIAQQMADHENPPEFARQIDEFTALPRGKTERLLNEDVFPGE